MTFEVRAPDNIKSEMKSLSSELWREYEMPDGNNHASPLFTHEY